MKPVLSIVISILFTTYSNAQNFPYELDWGYSMMGSYDDLKTDSEGNVYSIGGVHGNTDLDLDIDEQFILSTKGTGFLKKYDPNGGFIWAKSIGYIGKSIALDKNDNVYIIGESFYTSNSKTDVFIEKYNSNGELQWSQTFGGKSSEHCKSIVIDNNDNIYITGIFHGTVVYKIDGWLTKSIKSYDNQSDIFLLKLNSKGDFIWVKHMAGPEDEYLSTIITDKENYIYMVSSYLDSIDVGLSDDAYVLGADSISDSFLLKMDLEGELVWVKPLHSDFASFSDIKIDNEGDLIVSGSHSKKFDIDPNSDTFYLDTKIGSSFIAKFSTEGDLIWATNLQGEGRSFTYHIDFDSNNDLYVVGIFRETVDFDPSESILEYTSQNEKNEFTPNSDIYVQKYSTDGELIWTQILGSTEFDKPTAIHIDKEDQIYFSGLYIDTLFFTLNDSLMKYTGGVNDKQSFFMIKLSQPKIKKDILSDNFQNNKCYPNPSSESFNIEIEESFCSFVKVLDSNGSETDFTLTKQDGDLINLKLKGSPGLYFINLYSEELNKNKVFKVVLI